MADPKRAPYRKQASPRIDTKASKDMTVQPIPDEDHAVIVRMAGACPVCTHETRFDYPLIAIQGVEAGAGTEESLLKIADSVGQAAWSGNVRAHCLCGQAHKGQPDSEQGCGARWGMQVSWGQS